METVLLTGGTGFIGQVLLRMLVDRGYAPRVLVRPRARMTALPIPDVPLVVASLRDERGLRAALSGVETIVHLASAEGDRRRRDLLAVDVEGTRILLAQARQAGVRRILYLSHLGADRGSAFPFLQAKGIAEQSILDSGIPALLLRSSVVFGSGDAFTNVIAMMARVLPAVFPIPLFPSQLQPIWVEDLAACIDYCLAESAYFGETISVGGPEHMTFEEVVATILDATRSVKLITPIWPPLVRSSAEFLDWLLPHSPWTPFWVDYLSMNRVTEANSLSRLFGIRASRLRDRIGYLREGRGFHQLWQYLTLGDAVFRMPARHG